MKSYRQWKLGNVFQERDLELLRDVARHRLSDNLVVERQAGELAKEGYLKWHHIQPGYASLGDHYVLTRKGERALLRRRRVLREWSSKAIRRRRRATAHDRTR